MGERIQSKILVVDDDSVVNMVARDLLRELGFGAENVFEAYDGEEGLKLARRLDFALIISDWKMPVMDGIGLLTAIRAEEKTKSVPFLMITTDNDRLRVSEAVRAGATGFLPKPFTPHDFSEKIRVIFKDNEDVSKIDWGRFSRRVRQV